MGRVSHSIRSALLQLERFLGLYSGKLSYSRGCEMLIPSNSIYLFRRSIGPTSTHSFLIVATCGALAICDDKRVWQREPLCSATCGLALGRRCACGHFLAAFRT